MWLMQVVNDVKKAVFKRNPRAARVPLPTRPLLQRLQQPVPLPLFVVYAGTRCVPPPPAKTTEWHT